jgi:integrase
MNSNKRTRRGFGQVRRLPSKRWQAFYTGPDTRLHYALSTFGSKLDAEAWLVNERQLLSTEAWIEPKLRRAAEESKRPMTFGKYAELWMRDRDLKPRTREHYQKLLDHQLRHWDAIVLTDIKPQKVRDWHASQNKDAPTLRAHAYGLFRTILNTAVTDSIIPVNPAHIRGAGATKKVHRTKPLTLEEMERLTQAMPERLQPMILLSGWCALRFGELVELRRKDIDLKNQVIHVRRGATRADGQIFIDTPKSEAGIRDVSIPPHLIPVLKEHLRERMEWDTEALLFPNSSGETLAPSTLYSAFYPARESIGRPDFHFHDLRHTAAVLAAQTGATLAELMARLGHSTPAAALVYQHAAQGRDAEIAKAMSAMIIRN